MAQARVVVLNEARKGMAGDWTLCFQYAAMNTVMAMSKTATGSFGEGPTAICRPHGGKQGSPRWPIFRF